MKRFFGALLATLVVAGAVLIPATPVMAEEDATVSIRLESALVSLALEPGELRSGEFKVTNSGSLPFDMTVSPEFFTPGAINGDRFTSEGRFTEIQRWIRLATTEFRQVMPGESVAVRYTIDVPVDAPGGAQYAGINVTVGGGDMDSDSMGVAVARQLQYRIYAEVGGETVDRGNVAAFDIPKWVRSGDLVTSLALRNEGNTHFTAANTLIARTVFGREVYRSDDGENSQFVFPETDSAVVELTMAQPRIGIYRVTQSTMITGRTIEHAGWVIVAPTWLMVIVIVGLIAALALLAIWIVRMVKMDRQKKEAASV
ncbi:hypothetical protein FWH13_02375 [Candidatus Saccharibacteria bacterium]|nr:hypothetical protein [Candidatus Saccharibacteria bacterium]